MSGAGDGRDPNLKQLHASAPTLLEREQRHMRTMQGILTGLTNHLIALPSAWQRAHVLRFLYDLFRMAPLHALRSSPSAKSCTLEFFISYADTLFPSTLPTLPLQQEDRFLATMFSRILHDFVPLERALLRTNTLTHGLAYTMAEMHFAFIRRTLYFESIRQGHDRSASALPMGLTVLHLYDVACRYAALGYELRERDAMEMLKALRKQHGLPEQLKEWAIQTTLGELRKSVEELSEARAEEARPMPSLAAFKRQLVRMSHGLFHFSPMILEQGAFMLAEEGFESHALHLRAQSHVEYSLSKQLGIPA